MTTTVTCYRGNRIVYVFSFYLKHERFWSEAESTHFMEISVFCLKHDQLCAETQSDLYLKPDQLWSEDESILS